MKPHRTHILHVGVGAFHRSHQALVWDQLRRFDPVRYADWGITGVCLMPSDRALVQQLRKQNMHYTLREFSAQGTSHTRQIQSIDQVLLGPDDREAILSRISDRHTRVISLTITEGGYEIGRSLEHILKGEAPQTVFHYLALGLDQRRRDGQRGLILMSCDNIQENGAVLKAALDPCLAAIDPALPGWVEESVYFPNSMVDRITPATRTADVDALEQETGHRDEALVVSEDYFQWVLEDQVRALLPPIANFGVTFVPDVRPYEQLKLSVLNAGHSLVGFLGEAMGYRSIHESLTDPLIAAAFDQYALQEAIPVLSPLNGVDYAAYYQRVKSRFANPMLQDSTARIMAGSSDKIPKFLLPILRAQLALPSPQIDMATLVVALWWQYLDGIAQRAAWEELMDTRRDALRVLFEDSSSSAERLINYEPIFGELSGSDRFVSRYYKLIQDLQSLGVPQVLDPYFLKH